MCVNSPGAPGAGGRGLRLHDFYTANVVPDELPSGIGKSCFHRRIRPPSASFGMIPEPTGAKARVERIVYPFYGLIGPDCLRMNRPERFIHRVVATGVCPRVRQGIRPPL